MEYKDWKLAEAKEVTSKLTDFLNNFSYEENSAYFNEAMSREHRTLQQSFTRLAFQWIEFMASDEYRTDGRNQQSKQMAQELLEGFEKVMNEKYGKPFESTHRKPSRWLGTI